MKKSLLLAVLVFASATIFAQGFKIGPKVGINASGLNEKKISEGFDFGYQAGLFSEIMFTKGFGIQPELLFTQTNLKRADNLSTVVPELSQVNEIKLNYLSVPVLLNFKPVKFVTFQVGPQFSMLRNKEQSLGSNATAAFKSGDVALLGGVQLKVLSFRIYARYAVGLSDVSNLQSATNAAATGWKTRSIQAGVGLAL